MKNIEIEELGISALGSKENFDAWYNRLSLALGLQSPKMFVDRGEDQIVIDELNRIIHGVYA